MTATTSGVDTRQAPSDYADLFSTYRNYMLMIVRSMGVESDQVEDVVSDIMLKLYERNILAVFDPDRKFEHNGRECRANFKSFLYSVVQRYTLGRRDHLRRLRRWELNVLDDLPPGGSLFGHVVEASQDATLDTMVEEHLVSYIREYLVTVPRRSIYDNCDLPALFDQVVEHVRLYEQWDVPLLCDHFGVSHSAMYSWLWWLKVNVAHALGYPEPERQTRGAPR